MPLKRTALPLRRRGHRPWPRLAGAANTLRARRTARSCWPTTPTCPGAVAARPGALRRPASTAVRAGRRCDGGLDAAWRSAELGAAQRHPARPLAGARGGRRGRGRRHPSRPAGRGRLARARRRVAGDVVVSTVPPRPRTPTWSPGARGVPVVFEVIYDPWPTPLRRGGRGRRAVLVGGLDLLVHQAALQFELFTGRPGPARRDAPGRRASPRRAGRVMIAYRGTARCAGAVAGARGGLCRR